MHIIRSGEFKAQCIGNGLEEKHWAEKPDLKLYTPTLQGGGHSVMIWGCMTWAGLGPMVYIDATLILEIHIELLEDALHGSILKWKNIQRFHSSAG